MFSKISLLFFLVEVPAKSPRFSATIEEVLVGSVLWARLNRTRRGSQPLGRGLSSLELSNGGYSGYSIGLIIS